LQTITPLYPLVFHGSASNSLKGILRIVWYGQGQGVSTFVFFIGHQLLNAHFSPPPKPILGLACRAIFFLLKFDFHPVIVLRDHNFAENLSNPTFLLFPSRHYIEAGGGGGGSS